MTVYFLSVWLEPHDCQLHTPASLSAEGAFHRLLGGLSVWALVYGDQPWWPELSFTLHVNNWCALLPANPACLKSTCFKCADSVSILYATSINGSIDNLLFCNFCYSVDNNQKARNKQHPTTLWYMIWYINLKMFYILSNGFSCLSIALAKCTMLSNNN